MDQQLVMVIEDNEELCAIYRIALNPLYSRIIEIPDGKKAMEQLEEVVPHLIILDMNLPLVSGHAIYKRIRSDPRFDQTPVIIATANILAADTLKNEVDHLDQIVVKPMSLKFLRQVVEKMRQASRD
jgi:CheY-like chemotaxis protein